MPARLPEELTRLPDVGAGVDAAESRILKALGILGIAFARHQHQPIMTAAEGVEVARTTGAACMKNLFLREKKGSRLFLVMQPANRRLDFRRVELAAGCARLTFGAEVCLREHLGTYPGAVTPLGLIFDPAGRVEVLADRALEALELVDCHPCRNDVSLTVRLADVLGIWLPATGHAAWRWI